MRHWWRELFVWPLDARYLLEAGDWCFFFSPSASAQLATRRRRVVAQRAREPSMEWGRGGVLWPSERLRAVKSPWGDGASRLVLCKCGRRGPGRASRQRFGD
ncbi:hypothetical protein TGAM01_v200156 [Trichoderma gamsii]|uniref:Uncharacterized protein n=1 Tax=Trichoderma gamsii TaxID=398673 RepID=A0A2P5A2H1_9HYPO|nr:hypothetical protein TGAM01_v200156 [Trichoderma gamsii]PON30736.1 hypothetical protein TGAM01_v200156 [Trichoderma gamsii]